MWPGPYGDFGSRKYLLSSLDQSLGRLGLDYVDIFYSHRPDPETPIEETMGALASAVQQGKALYVGISNYDPEQTTRRCRRARRAQGPAAHPPAALLDVRPPHRGRAVPRARRARHRQHRVLAARAGPAHRPLPRRQRPDRTRAPPTSRFLSEDSIDSDYLERVRGPERPWRMPADSRSRSSRCPGCCVTRRSPARSSVRPASPSSSRTSQRSTRRRSPLTRSPRSSRFAVHGTGQR